MKTLFAQSRVDDILKLNPKYRRLEELSSTVDNVMADEANTPVKTQLIDNELKYEHEKWAKDVKKLEKKNVTGKNSDDDQDIKFDDNDDAPLTDVISLLFVFTKTKDKADEDKIAGKRHRSKKYWAMTLWSDGPAANAVSSFSGTKLLEEYTSAVTRQSLSLQECGCKYCERDYNYISAEMHEKHIVWHEKFRKFLLLRKAKYPEFKDFHQNICKSAIDVVLYTLVRLWQEVDGELPYFSTSAFTEYDERSEALQVAYEKKAKKTAATKATKKAAQDKASTLDIARQQALQQRILRYAQRIRGVRVPREFR